ncbi:MAG: FGGY-family carbohydrate kinase [Spirochaetes bacterium]|jgi:xylulokinase|nr:FGGY-family carbohydrate kinase [Spirochaetota bacterium]
MASKKERYILAIDLGTSGPKAAVVTAKGEVLGHEFEKNELILHHDGGAEQRPDEWWDSIVRAVKRLLRRKLVPADLIEAVSCTTQWAGTVPVDREGNHLMNAIIWLDSRGARHVRSIAGGLVGIKGYGLLKLMRWIRLTGAAPSLTGKDSIAHILYIKHELPEIYRRTYKFLEPMDYINLRLTGEFASSFDSITLHWVTDNRDISKIKYDDRLLKYSTIDRDKFPDIWPPIHVLGNLSKQAARELGLREDVRVVMGMPDLQSAAIGSGAVRDYEAHVYIGTSSWLLCHVPFKKTDLFHNFASIPSAVPGRYIVATEQETAGECLTFIKDNILYHKDELLENEKQPDVYKIFDRMAARVPAGSGGVIFTPWLFGERSPIEDEHVRASISNISLDTTREHIIRAVYEGVAFNSRWLLGYVESFIKRRFSHVNMIGGGANSDIWCQIYADVFNRKIQQVKDPIVANLRGAAFVASVALGHVTFDEIPDLVKISRVYEPDPDNRAVYDGLFREFVNIYRANRKMYSRLNRF